MIASTDKGTWPMPIDGKSREADVWIYDDDRLADLGTADAFGGADFERAWWSADDEHVYVRLGNGQTLVLWLSLEEEPGPETLPEPPKLVLMHYTSGEATS